MKKIIFILSLFITGALSSQVTVSDPVFDTLNQAYIDLPHYKAQVLYLSGENKDLTIQLNDKNTVIVKMQDENDMCLSDNKFSSVQVSSLTEEVKSLTRINKVTKSLAALVCTAEALLGVFFIYEIKK